MKDQMVDDRSEFPDLSSSLRFEIGCKNRICGFVRQSMKLAGSGASDLQLHRQIYNFSLLVSGVRKNDIPAPPDVALLNL
jgi:hypothetical protein